MCSISGLIATEPSSIFVEMLKQVILKAEERGRDGFGICTPRVDYRFMKSPSAVKLQDLQFHPAMVMLNNNRAEPTTEFIDNKTLNDVQPFRYTSPVTNMSTIVAHNGTIANDKELASKYGIKQHTYIDSGVLPELFDNVGVLQGLSEINGSYAMAVHQQGVVWLACNYKPIYIKRLRDAFLFSSLDTYLRTDWNDNIVRQKPYTALEINPLDLTVVEHYLRPVTTARQKVLVICSGGMDSVVTATSYVRNGNDVTLLHFTYGCRAEAKEIEAVTATAKRLGCGHKFIDMSHIFKSEVGGSPLLQPNDNIMRERDGEKGAELAYEWVPARNLVFYSLALAYAEAHGYDTIALGNNLEESGAYPDNEMIFSRLFNDLIPNAVNKDVNIHVEQPVGNLMKHEIVALGLELFAPLDVTWSCYEAGDRQCGRCGPCYMRRKAFQMNGIEDVIQYEH